MNVLFLSTWYPSVSDKMAGLFVYKHAVALNKQGVNVRVNTWWRQADIVQLNVLTLKMGMVAYVMKRVLGIPYILVEHWSGYMPENGQYMRFPSWKRRLLEEIAREAEGIYTVSERLEQAMKACGITHTRWGRVENVVDDFFYASPVPQLERTKQCQLIHVSCYEEQSKNIKGLLRVIKRLSILRQDFRLTLVGNGKDWEECRTYAKELNIPDTLLRWTGEIPPEKVAERLRESHVNLLTSRYETYGIPLAEAMAVGIPSIETDTCGLQLPKGCGLIVPSDNEEQLLLALNEMIDTYHSYNPQTIRQHGLRFAEDRVGKSLLSIYLLHKPLTTNGKASMGGRR